MLLRLVPRSFGRVVQQANRICLEMLMVFLQPLYSHLSHDPFPSLRSLDPSSRVALFPSPAADIKTKTEARKELWLGVILYAFGFKILGFLIVFRVINFPFHFIKPFLCLLGRSCLLLVRGQSSQNKPNGL